MVGRADVRAWPGPGGRLSRPDCVNPLYPSPLSLSRLSPRTAHAIAAVFLSLSLSLSPPPLAITGVARTEGDLVHRVHRRSHGVARRAGAGASDPGGDDSGGAAARVAEGCVPKEPVLAAQGRPWHHTFEDCHADERDNKTGTPPKKNKRKKNQHARPTSSARTLAHSRSTVLSRNPRSMKRATPSDYTRQFNLHSTRGPKGAPSSRPGAHGPARLPVPRGRIV